MQPDILVLLKKRLDSENFRRLAAIDNPALHAFVVDNILLCNPDAITVVTDSVEGIRSIREKALSKGEEIALAVPGHTAHFDAYDDQARDKENTLFLLSKGEELGPHFNSKDRDEGIREVRGILKDIMRGREMFVRFFCLGPLDSPFSVLACQLTDSAYVAHNLDLLYRQGYEAFRRQGASARFFRVVHGQGELENGVSKNLHLRRVYVDTADGMVYSANTQYGGNTLGLKKLSMRLAIHRASQEGWLCEHMFLMGVHGPSGRKTYFTGAFPSMCGKTSTAMLNGETIVGDDIAYLRAVEGEIRAVNVERGMFGIIMGVNAQDDPLLWKTLHAPGEIIFSNVLVTPERSVYWLGKGTPEPAAGRNHSGEWTPGKTDARGKPVDPSHKNARFTLSLSSLENVDPRLEDRAGVPVGGVLYGARDSSAWVPVRQSFDWTHGIATIAASLESETTAATLSREGVVSFDPMSNLDFVSIPLGRYVQNNLSFGKSVKNPPPIFGLNYFLRDEGGAWLNAKTDKAVWLKWAEHRVHGEMEGLKTPVGLIPRFEDLKAIFGSLQNKEYTQAEYVKQFSIRVKEFLAKMERIERIYRTQVRDVPAAFFDALREEVARLEEAKARSGDRIPPEAFT